MDQFYDIEVTVRAEQSVLGALLADSDALDRVADLAEEHFYRHDHRMIFAEIRKQVLAGKQADPLTVFEKLNGKIDDCLPYLGKLRASSPSSANIAHHAAIIIEEATKRALVALSDEMRALASSKNSAASCVELVTSKLDALTQKRTSSEPRRFSETLARYADLLNRRFEGLIRPVETGFRDLDAMMGGGFERGTLTVIAGRPGTGKTAAGLAIARNRAENGGSALFLSMEMSEDQVNDRMVAALGKIPVRWLRKPTQAKPTEVDYWSNMTTAFAKAPEMSLFIDDKTGLNMIEIRAKARGVKRKCGLDLLVVDQLSFITGALSDKSYEAAGEYTRGLVALSKELDCAVILLCQLNRECEKRHNKRPIMADLAVSGSIEQDAANIIFLYRDVLYNPQTKDRDICEWNSVKQRQGEPGVIALGYDGSTTSFYDLPYPWSPQPVEEIRERRRGFE
jgi:replicative DNA helicase